MKIIDKLFGKIRPNQSFFLDFGFIIFLLLFIVPMGFGFGYGAYMVFRNGDQKTPPLTEFCKLETKVRDYELLLDSLEKNRDVAYRERDSVIIQRDEIIKERDGLQNRIDNFYKKEPKRAKKYFK